MDKRWNNKVLSTADIAVNWKQLVWYYKALHFRILLKNPPQIQELALQMGSVAWYYLVTPQFYMFIKGACDLIIRTMKSVWVGVGLASDLITR